MKIQLRPILALGFALAACGDLAEPDATPGDDPALGTLQLALTGMDAQMQRYRLRGATFDVQGTRYTDYQPVLTTISSESDPDGELLSTRLFQGYYTIALRPEDWYIERISAEGAARVEHVALLSSAQQSTSITAGAASRIAFQFGVDGEPIDFLGGKLEIGISILNAPGSAGAGQ
ncbi:MAG TPA: hypothetical protein VK509_02475 [Polyangiales bacterium]|nr:hypothetical protein [Polyangiales bacterium]